MRNILKGLLKPEAEVYVLPDADEIRFDDEEELIDPPAEEEEQQPLSLDITLGEEEPAVETPPGSSIGASSLTSAPVTPAAQTVRMASSSWRKLTPPASGVPVPGKAEGSRQSRSMVK